MTIVAVTLTREGIEGVPEDDAEAVRWYRLAADQGNAFAQNNLGVMYAMGEGVPIDDILAHMWFNIAGTNGNKRGKENREIHEQRMTADNTNKAKARARVCFASGYKECGD